MIYFSGILYSISSYYSLLVGDRDPIICPLFTLLFTRGRSSRGRRAVALRELFTIVAIIAIVRIFSRRRGARLASCFFAIVAIALIRIVGFLRVGGLFLVGVVGVVFRSSGFGERGGSLADTHLYTVVVCFVFVGILVAEDEEDNDHYTERKRGREEEMKRGMSLWN